MQLDDSWKGMHLIRTAPRLPTVQPEEIDRDDVQAKLIALRKAAAAGRRRVEVAAELGLTYNQAVHLCQKHGISFVDPRFKRRREGAV